MATIATTSRKDRGSANAELDHRVQRAIALHPHLRTRRIEIRLSQGRVVLSGRVHSYYEKQMAQEAIRGMDEIESIANEIMVDWTMPNRSELQLH